MFSTLVLMSFFEDGKNKKPLILRRISGFEVF